MSNVLPPLKRSPSHPQSLNIPSEESLGHRRFREHQSTVRGSPLLTLVRHMDEPVALRIRPHSSQKWEKSVTVRLED